MSIVIAGCHVVAYDVATGNQVEVGDPVTDFRGERGVLRSLDAVQVPGKSGKVTVELLDDDGLVYHYDKVWGLRVVAIPDHNARQSGLTV